MIFASESRPTNLQEIVWFHTKNGTRDDDSVSSLDSVSSFDDDEETDDEDSVMEESSGSPRTPTRSSGRRIRHRSSFAGESCRQLAGGNRRAPLSIRDKAAIAPAVPCVKLNSKPDSLRSIMNSLAKQINKNNSQTPAEEMRGMLSAQQEAMGHSSRWTDLIDGSDHPSRSPRAPDRQPSGEGLEEAAANPHRFHSQQSNKSFSTGISTHTLMTTSMSSCAADTYTTNSNTPIPASPQHASNNTRSRRRFSQITSPPRLTMADTSSLRRVRFDPARRNAELRRMNSNASSKAPTRNRLQNACGKDSPRLPPRQTSNESTIVRGTSQRHFRCN